jgi:hypothetical protein
LFLFVTDTVPIRKMHAKLLAQQQQKIRPRTYGTPSPLPYRYRETTGNCNGRQRNALKNYLSSTGSGRFHEKPLEIVRVRK